MQIAVYLDRQTDSTKVCLFAVNKIKKHLPVFLTGEVLFVFFTKKIRAEQAKRIRIARQPKRGKKRTVCPL